MKTRDQILSMLRAGRLHECAQEVQRYGQNKQDTIWEEDPTKNSDGCQNFRASQIVHLGWIWSFMYVDGECREFSGKPDAD